MGRLSAAEWAMVRRMYVTSTDPMAAIAERFGIAPGTLYARRRLEGWPERGADNAGAVKNGAVKAGAAAAGLDDATEPPDLIERFYRLIRLKLDQMEDDMARSRERTPADNERETRALGTLIRNFEKVFGLARECGNDGKQTADEAGGHDEAERIRRELAERLVRLRGSGDSDGDSA